MVLRALHLCSGYGGFELALRDMGVRTVCHVERDSYAAAVLVARMEEQRLDQAPIWSDLETFDGTSWRGRVDLITAGFPCQPFSAAGKRGGVDDDRWLWPSIARIVREVGPRFVFLENVPQLVRHGLPYVLDDLAEIGFDAEWGLLSASAVGAPHKRERFWIVGVTRSDERAAAFNGGHEQAEPWVRPVARRSITDDVADTRCAGRPEIAGGVPQDAPGEVGSNGSGRGNGEQLDGCGQVVADPSSARRQGSTRQRRLQPFQPASHCYPPRPGDLDGWAEWGGSQPAIRRGADGAPVGLADALHLGGNGLVPQCATEAWRQLTARLNDE